MKPHSGRSGQALLITTLSLGVVFGAIGLSVDVGWAYYRREAAQAAADGAAMAVVRAALINAPTGITCSAHSVWCGAAADCPSTAPTTATSTFDNGCMMAAANGFTTSGGKRVNIQANNTSSAPTVSGVSTNYWAVVRVSDTPPSFFGRLTGFGLNSTARATAAVMGGGSGGAGCIYVLDPHAADAFDAGNNNSVTTQCGIYVNSDASGSSEAMHVYGSAHVTASNGSAVDVVGSVKTDNGGVITPTPTKTSAAADPFSSLPSPTPANTCQAGNFTAWQASQYTPAPGTYCTFQLGNGMSAQLTSGTYIINGGSFSVQGGSTLTATGGGVLIYLTGGAYVNIANGANVTLQALSSGSYQGVLFYQDRTMTNPTTSNFAGGSTMNLQGSLYFPNSLLTIDNGNQTRIMGLVAGRVKFQGGATINVATSVAQTGLPLSATPTVAMIE
jgi:hypothetical protein